MEWVRTYGCLVSARRGVIYSEGKALSGGHWIEGRGRVQKCKNDIFYIFYSIWETSLIYGINRKLPWIPPPLRSISSNISKTKIIVFLWQVTHKANYCDKLFFYKCPALSLSLPLSCEKEAEASDRNVCQKNGRFRPTKSGFVFSLIKADCKVGFLLFSSSDF